MIKREAYGFFNIVISENYISKEETYNNLLKRYCEENMKVSKHNKKVRKNNQYNTKHILNKVFVISEDINKEFLYLIELLSNNKYVKSINYKKNCIANECFITVVCKKNIFSKPFELRIDFRSDTYIKQNTMRGYRYSSLVVQNSNLLDISSEELHSSILPCLTFPVGEDCINILINE